MKTRARDWLYNDMRKQLMKSRVVKLWAYGFDRACGVSRSGSVWQERAAKDGVDLDEDFLPFLLRVGLVGDGAAGAQCEIWRSFRGSVEVRDRRQQFLSPHAGLA